MNYELKNLKLMKMNTKSLKLYYYKLDVILLK